MLDAPEPKPEPAVALPPDPLDNPLEVGDSIAPSFAEMQIYRPGYRSGCTEVYRSGLCFLNFFVSVLDSPEVYAMVSVSGLLSFLTRRSGHSSTLTKLEPPHPSFILQDYSLGVCYSTSRGSLEALYGNDFDP